MKSPSLRRIQADIRELAIDPSDRYHAAPLENDMFEWHFTIKGADGTDFEGGIYHGRILLPAEYPFKPPNIVFLTPTGRFETNTKVCLSFSAYHPELWQPAWGIRLILEALISFLPTKGDGAIGALDWSSEERKRLAKESRSYVCPHCGSIADIIKDVEEKVKIKRANDNKNDGDDSSSNKFLKQIEHLHELQATAEGGKKDDKKVETEVTTDEKENDVKQNDENPNSVTEDSAQKKESVLQESNRDDEAVEPTSSKTDTLNKDTVILKNDAQSAEEEADPLNQEKVDEKNEQVTNIAENLESAETPFFSDPVVHVGIVILIAIICLILRKINSLMEELKALESEIRAT